MDELTGAAGSMNAGLALAMAANAYTDPGVRVPILGWSVRQVDIPAGPEIDSPTAVSLLVYSNAQTGETVVSFRGTATVHDATVSDLAILRQEVPDAATLALDWANTEIDALRLGGDVTFVGHSLGGYLAQFVSAQLQQAPPGLQS